MLRMKRKWLGVFCLFVILGVCFGFGGVPRLQAQEDQSDIGIIEHESQEVEGDNYGYIPIGRGVPVSLDNAGTIQHSSGLNGSGTLPVSYDAREKGHVSPVKNQGLYGTCWAFAAVSAAESDAIIDGREANPDYSEAQLAWFTYHRITDPLGGLEGDGIELCDPSDDYRMMGGNAYISTMSLASWISPADEKTMDYDDIGTKYYSGASVDSSLGYDACVAHLQDVYWVSMEDIESVKKLIMQHGSIESAIFFDEDYIKYESELGKHLFYNPNLASQNHEISLVGWDDNISAEYFTKTIGGKEYTPKGDGAWLVKNSYGEYSHDDGYFWISYYDEGLLYISYDDGISSNIAAAYNFESADNYDYNYQYDGGYTTYEIYSSEDCKSVYCANVFTVQNSAQQLEAVSFYTTMPKMEYSIQVYKVTEEGTPLGTPLMASSVNGFEEYSGYHTIELDEKILLEEGDKFSVVVKNTITTVDYYDMGATAFYDAASSDGYLRYVSASQSGQSYISFDGGNWLDMYEFANANLRVKAFTNEISVELESIDIDKDIYILGIDEELPLTVSVTPENVVISEFVWSSDNEEVAIVDDEGVVKAIGAGTAVITVKTNDGSKTDSCIVKVKTRHETPEAPTISTRTDTEIVLQEITGAKYSMDKETWQASNIFSDLNPGTSYTFYVKLTETEDYYESLPSQGLTVCTYSTVSGITLSSDTLRLEIGKVEGGKITATVIPSDVMDKTVTWTSENEDIATVDADGNVTAIAPGRTTITAATNSGNKSASCTVEVYKAFDKPNAPVLECVYAYSVTLAEQDGYMFSMDKTFWTSQNIFSDLKENTTYTFYVKKVASGYYLDSEISDGLEVTTLKAVNNIELDKTNVELCLYDSDKNESTYQFTAKVEPIDAENIKVAWSSSNDKIVTVDQTGKVTAVGAGEAIITARSVSFDVNTTCKITVWDKFETPQAPQLLSKSESKVELKKIDGCVYSKDGINWQSSNIFSNLEPETTYTFYVKKSKAGFYVESDKSQGLAVTTDKETTGGDAGNTGGTTGGDTGSTSGGNAGGTGTATPFVAPDIKVSYRTHIQTFGWEGKADNINTWKSNGSMSGTSGLAKRLEGINIVVNPTVTSDDLDLGIQYTTHCQSYGWLPWSADGDMNGTEGEAKRLEAIMIQLTGEHADLYDVYYRVHAQSYGWLGWAKDGAPAGTAGYGKRLEGIQIVVVKSGESFERNMGGITSKSTKAFEANAGSSPIVNYQPTSNTNPVVPGADDVNVAYRTHVQSFGWQGWKYNGQMSGTSGLAKRLEGIEIKLTNKDYYGGIAYCTHVQTYGWQGADLSKPSTWKQDGEMSGTSGEAKRLEAICITLTGEMAEHYDIYYRVHAQSYGWLGWAKNGEASGTAGYGKRLEGIQVVIVPKGNGAPDKTYMGVTTQNSKPFIQK